jgi:hypothetical protein
MALAAWPGVVPGQAAELFWCRRPYGVARKPSVLPAAST